MRLTFLCLSILLAVTVSAYNQRSALNYAYLSNVAYQQINSINNWNCNDCRRFQMQHPKAFFYSGWDIQGFAGHVNLNGANVIVVAFRGSVDAKNWIANLDAGSTVYPNCPNCHVHSGFYGAYQGISPMMRAEVQNLRSLYRGAPLVLTGHSLGGAMACLAAIELSQLYGSVKQVYTFGEPRVGDSSFASYFQSRVYSSFRVVHFADIVPHLPPSNFGFFHEGTEVWYNEQMATYQVCSSEAPNCSNSLSVSQYSTNDHYLSNYLRMPGIQKLIPGLKPSGPLDMKGFINSIESLEELRKVEEKMAEIRSERQNPSVLNKNIAFFKKLLRVHN